MKEELKYRLDLNTYLTFGYYTLDGFNEYEFDKEFVKQLISNGNAGKKLNIHCWLTLESTEILDFSISQTYISNEDSFLFLNHENNNDHIIYHPVVIGEELLIKIGAVEL